MNKKKMDKATMSKAQETAKNTARPTKGKAAGTEARTAEPTAKEAKKARNRAYEDKLAHLQVEIAHLQAWVKASGARIVIIFEGRDAAGKGGVIRRLTERVSPRVAGPGRSRSPSRSR
jgi:polyphosphate kinase 2 (PPK2 family)